MYGMLAQSTAISFGVVFAILMGCVLLALLWNRWACLPLWMCLFFYPSRLTSQALPLNIGGDDLTIVALFLVVLLRTRMSSEEIRLGPIAFLALSLVILELVSSTFGLIGAPTEYPMVLFLKGILKRLRPILIVLVVVNSCSNLSDVRRYTYSFLLAASGSFLIAIGQYYKIGVLDIFTSDHVTSLGDAYELGTRRFSGVFAGPWALGGVATIIAPVAMAVFLRDRLKGKIIGLLGLATAVTATFYTQSRGALVGIGAAVMLGVLLFVPKKGRALVFVGLLGLMLMLFGLFERVEHRWEKAAVFESLQNLDNPSGAMGDRIRVMKEVVEAIPTWGYFTGVGQEVMLAYGAGKSHSLYLQVWLGFGILGIIFFVACLTKGFWVLHRSKSLEQAMPGAALREGIGMAIVGLMFLGLSAEVIGSVDIMEIFFVVLAIFWCYIKAVQTPYLTYEEQMQL